MAETAVDIDALDEDNAPASYTTETEAPVEGRGQSITAPGMGLGRRKEAVARVRLLPGTGQWTINGRTLEDYFPNKLHQQLVRAPFTILDLEGRFDVIARINGGGVSGQAGALRLGVARALNEIAMADAVQLLSAVVLFILAMGTVKGFAFTLGVTTGIDLFIVFFFTHPLVTLLGRTAFFGQGKRFSGFEPEHLGVSRASLTGLRRARGGAPAATGDDGDRSADDSKES